jgi:hypothetical protein
VNLVGKVDVRATGRCGQVMVSLGPGEASFYWEYGGGDCIAIVSVPSEEEWTSTAPLREYPRNDFLDALARELIGLQCPGARFEVSSRFIHILASS